MRRRSLWCVLFACAVAALAVSVEQVIAQAPARGGTQTPGRAAGATAARPASQTHADMAQLMRGIMYPNANVIFAAQSDDPATIKPASDPSISPNPLTSTYGGWQAVENAGLALAESANLLTIPRACSNGRQAPVTAADWVKAVADMRAAGVAAFKAARAKNQDAIVDVSDKMTTACSDCHDVYREKPDLKARCAK
jgi:hypothetical protein